MQRDRVAGGEVAPDTPTEPGASGGAGREAPRATAHATAPARYAGRGRLLAALFGLPVLAAIGFALVLRRASSERSEPARCPPGLVNLGPRCCPPGQRLAGHLCVGEARRCPATMELRQEPARCIARAAILRYAAGRLELGPSDWEAQGVVQPRSIDVDGFGLDRSEVTVERWRECVAARHCPLLDDQQSVVQDARQRRALLHEPGLPVTGVGAEAAERYCAHAGGRLPTEDEWLYAAAGPQGRRYPWGMTGLVCRRASYGLVEGPCAFGGGGPELAGARPDGASPEGALDLAGNVAEWARAHAGGYVALGGSFRSRGAAELKSWSREAPAGPAGHVGFRCAYAAAAAR